MIYSVSYNLFVSIDLDETVKCALGKLRFSAGTSPGYLHASMVFPWPHSAARCKQTNLRVGFSRVEILPGNEDKVSRGPRR